MRFADANAPFFLRVRGFVFRELLRGEIRRIGEPEITRDEIEADLHLRIFRR